MNDISGFGTSFNIRASKTFPGGFDVVALSDDTDPLDSPSQQVGDVGVGLNGHMVTWRTANPIQLTLAVIPDTEDQRNLSVLLEANRAARGKRPVNDEITITATYPMGKTVTWTGGAITDGTLTPSLANAGRLKTMTYIFKFENVVGL